MNSHLDVLRRLASANDELRPEPGSNFVNNVLSMLERTEYRRCDGGEDLEDIYRLRYKSYRLSDMVPENAEHMVRDALDEAPNCFRFGIYIDGTLAGTLRLHHVTAAMPRSPSMTVYGDVLQPLLDGGASFIDPSRFAVDPDFSRNFPQIPYLTVRLAGMAALHFQAPYGLSTIREEHAGFYKRIWSARQVGDLRSYPGLNYKVVLYMTDVEAIRENFHKRFPFFRSSRVEQRMLFAQPTLGESAPLTVLPTAKYLQKAA